MNTLSVDYRIQDVLQNTWMERKPDTNKSQRELFYSFGILVLQVPMFPGKVEKGNYTSEEIYERADIETDFQYKM